MIQHGGCKLVWYEVLLIICPSIPSDEQITSCHELFVVIWEYTDMTADAETNELAEHCFIYLLLTWHDIRATMTQQFHATSAHTI